MNSADADKMELRLDSNFKPNSAIKFSQNPSTSLFLTGVSRQDGFRTVYGRFYDQAGNTQDLSGKILVDLTPP